MTPIRRVIATLAVAIPAVLLSTGPALGEIGSPGDDAGAAVVVDAVNTGRELDEFDSATAFRLRLPDGASCAGDSANDDYRVQTFLVPADTDLSSMKYRSRSPDGSDLYRALRYSDGESAIQLPTDQNSEAGQPGLIVEPALPYTFAFYSENSLPPGSWKLGVACTPADWIVDRFWAAEVQLESAPDVVPGGLRIRVVQTEDAGSAAQSNGNPPVVAILAGSALAIAAIVLVLRRSSKSNVTPTKEYQ